MTVEIDILGNVVDDMMNPKIIISLNYCNTGRFISI